MKPQLAICFWVVGVVVKIKQMRSNVLVSFRVAVSQASRFPLLPTFMLG